MYKKLSHIIARPTETSQTAVLPLTGDLYKSLHLSPVLWKVNKIKITSKILK